MTFPAIIFSIIISSLYASVYHFIKGGNLFTLIIYIIVSVGGFFGGQYLADLLEISFFQLGTINFGVGSLCSLTLLFIGGWISRPIK
ncbi:MAG: hypothetical protein AB9907_03065 [Flexilinea sp.]|jgi:hypothetical protein